MSLYTETILPPREAKGLSRWVAALIIVIAIHLAVGAWIVMRRSFDRPAGQPTNAMFIDLASIATAPAQAAPPAPKPEAAPPKIEPPPPPPEPPMQSVPEAPAVMTAPPPVMPPIPKILQTEESPVTLPPPPPPKPVPDKVQEQKQIDLQKRVEQERKRKKQAELRKKRAEEQKELRKERAERAKAAANARVSRAASRAAAPRTGDRGQSIAAWQRGVQARVSAAAHSVSSGSGSATLTFTVEANGRVVAPHIAQSSGSAAVDRAILSIPRRIGRLPPPPNGRISVRVPVRFSGF